MKYLLLLLIPGYSFAQDGYGSIGSSLLVTKGKNDHSVNFGAGYRFKEFGVGFTTDFYLKQDFNITALDLRGYSGNFYLSVQPGAVLYDKDGVRGSYALSGVVGWQPTKLPMATFNTGYQYYSFKFEGDRMSSDAFKLTALFTFK